jgi:hypothetical protein
VAAQTPRKREQSVAELLFKTRLDLEKDVLMLHYDVENRAARDAYLLNRVHDQSLHTTPDLIYIDLDRDRRIVRAYKRVPAIPKGMSPTMPATPYVTPLRAGQSFSETVRINLPVHEFSAYVAMPENGRTVAYTGLTLTLGYYWSMPGMKERTQNIIPGVEVLIPTPPPGVRVEFGELSSEVLRADFAVWETAS